jgi:ElaB/YqjD/DUF883 family membrane-anchored ribosome-binding protein
MAIDTNEDPAEIEREIRRTQDDMSSTVDKIGDQLSIKNVFNSLLDKADESNIDARMVIDGARRNPVALALIAAGAIWLVSDNDAKLPKLGGKLGKKRHDYSAGVDPEHDEYLTHMSTVEQAEGEDDADFGRRRDTARSGFFNVKRNEGESEGGFSKRLDSLTEKLRNKRHDWAASSSNASKAARQKAQAAFGRTQGLYTDNPLISGILAAAVGAAFGSALPVTNQEKEKLRPLGQKARDTLDQQKERVTEQVRTKKDELLEKADAAISNTSAASEQQAASSGQNGQSVEPFLV